ncbi:hypothetical protein SLA2020_428860 [Shorea laevis]
MKSEWRGVEDRKIHDCKGNKTEKRENRQSGVSSRGEAGSILAGGGRRESGRRKGAMERGRSMVHGREASGITVYR